MNNSIYFILILFAGISCSEPEKQSELSEIYQSLSDQKQFYYTVEHSIHNSIDNSSSSLYGMVSLNRNSDSGISSGYFGLSQNKLPNYLHSMYLKREWIYDISSNIFNLADADILSDSMHSPILINPELLYKIEADSVKITKHKISEKAITWTFDLKQKSDQLVLLWDPKNHKISELEYKYDVDSENSYSRKWSFNYLTKSDYTQLETEYKRQNQIAHQPFL